MQRHLTYFVTFGLVGNVTIMFDFWSCPPIIAVCKPGFPAFASIADNYSFISFSGQLRLIGNWHLCEPLNDPHGRGNVLHILLFLQIYS